MGKSRGLNWEVNQSTAGGATFKQHWKGDKGLKTLKKVKRLKYSHIIYQEHSTYPLKVKDSTKKYLTKLFDVSNPNAQKHLYATWIYPGILNESRSLPSGSLHIERALKSIQPTPETNILPVGRAFDLFHLRHPEISLLSSDAKHPNSIGSYLAACVMFAKISKQPSKGLVRRIASKEKKGKQIYYFIVEQDAAEKCQLIADEIVFNAHRGEKTSE